MYNKNCTPPPRSRRATNPTPDRPEGGVQFFVHICILLYFFLFTFTLYMIPKNTNRKIRTEKYDPKNTNRKIRSEKYEPKDTIRKIRQQKK